MPSELLSQLKKKSMIGNKETKLNIAKNLADKISDLLNGEVHYSTLLDSRGVETKKISIIYKDNDDTGMDLQ